MDCHHQHYIFQTNLPPQLNYCDYYSDCSEGLFCWQRNRGDEVPGCVGGLDSTTDFCVDEKYLPLIGGAATYVPTLEETTEGTLAGTEGSS